jgi:hypothetical protein
MAVSSRPIPPQKHRDVIDHISNIIFVLTFFAALAAAAFTARQAYLANKQLVVARNTFRVTQDTEKRQLRAHVTIFEFMVTGGFAVNQQIIWRAKMRNFGPTPAYHVGVKGFIEVAARSPVRAYLIKDYRAQTLETSYTVYPGRDEEIYPSDVHILDEEALKKFQAGQVVYLYYGTVYYADIFGDKWATDYCFALDYAAITNQKWFACTNHHGADHESEGDLSKR